MGRHEVVDALGGAVGAMSEPMVSHDAVAFYLLSEAVARSLKVVQSGQGADEVFAGYSWYPRLQDAPGLGDGGYRAAFFDRPLDVQALLARAPAADNVSGALVHEHFARPGADEPVDRALRLDTEVSGRRPRQAGRQHDDGLGLKARTPFLDHELVELAAACPPALKLAHGGKGVLKEAARGLVPDAVIDRPKGYSPSRRCRASSADVELARER